MMTEFEFLGELFFRRDTLSWLHLSQNFDYYRNICDIEITATRLRNWEIESVAYNGKLSKFLHFYSSNNIFTD